jgi:hypothetical protein
VKPAGRALLQSGLREHLQKLLLRPHVDGFRGELAAAIVNERFFPQNTLKQEVKVQWASSD